MAEEIALGDDYTAIRPIGSSDISLSGRTAPLHGLIPPYCFGEFVLTK